MVPSFFGCLKNVCYQIQIPRQFSQGLRRSTENKNDEGRDISLRISSGLSQKVRYFKKYIKGITRIFLPVA
jgi:hypothetical protein